MNTMETESLPRVTGAFVDEALRRGREEQARAFRRTLAAFGRWMAATVRALGPHYVPWFEGGSRHHHA